MHGHKSNRPESRKAIFEIVSIAKAYDDGAIELLAFASRSGVWGLSQTRWKSLDRAIATSRCCSPIPARKRTQLLVPIGFQCIGDQAVGGIDVHVAPLRQLGFVASALHSLLPQPAGFIQPQMQLPLNFQCNL